MTALTHRVWQKQGQTTWKAGRPDAVRQLPPWSWDFLSGERCHVSLMTPRLPHGEEAQVTREATRTQVFCSAAEAPRAVEQTSLWLCPDPQSARVS